MNIKEFESAAEEFIQDAQLNNLAQNTIRAYESDINSFMYYMIKNKLKVISSKRIKGYFAILKSKGMSATSLKRKVSTLSRIIGEDFPKSLSIKTEKYLPDILTDKEIEKLEKAIKDDREDIIVNILLVTGMRVSELWSLDTDDVKEDKFKIRGKGAKERMIYFVPELYKRFQNILNKKGQPLLTNARGNRLSMVSIREILHNVVERAGIDKNITPHSLRHTYATRLIENNVDIYRVRNALGHSSVDTTARYVHLVDTVVESEIRDKGRFDMMVTKGKKGSKK